MKRSSSITIPLFALLLSSPLSAKQPAPKPADKGPEEKIQVTLVQVEAVVMDKDGRTVPGLTKDDFSMKIGGAPVRVSAVDMDCPIGAAADPVPIKKDQATVAPIAPKTKRRVVFAFDYAFLDFTTRPQVLDAAERMLRMSKTDDEEVMIVALASEVRVEQKFTKDIRQLAATLSRMKHDVTLWARDVPVGSSGESYFGGYSTLMDVLASYDGAKAVVLFSQANNVGARMRDLYYNEVAAHAWAGRGAIYPARPFLLDSGAGDTLVRLANGTGGRMQFISNDLSLPYRRAQRDLSCRYTVAAEVGLADARNPLTLSVKLNNKPGLSIRTPSTVQVFTDEARQQARLRAAYTDPGPFERPLVRAFGWSAAPTGSGKWDTLIAVSFPAPARATSAELDVRAVVRRNNQTVTDYKRRIQVDPPSAGDTSRPVTLMGDTPLKAGQYNLTVVLTDPNGTEIVTAQTEFVVPTVIDDLLLLRGPIMGRAVPGGLFLRANAKEQAQDTRLGKLLGPDNGFEPLLVGEIDRNDKLLYYWSACVSGENPLSDDVVVSRSVKTAAGAGAYATAPVPLKLEPRGKGISCLDMLETIPPNALASGDYRLDVTVMHPNGDVIARDAQPLTVR